MVKKKLLTIAMFYLYKVIEEKCNAATDMSSAIGAIQSDPKAEESLFVLCDNVYRRISGESLCIANTGHRNDTSKAQFVCNNGRNTEL